MVRSRRFPLLLPLFVLTALLLSIGCGLLSTEGGDTYFDSQLLASGRLLFAGQFGAGGGGPLSLYTLDPTTVSSPGLYGSGSFDFGGPSVAQENAGQWSVIFGVERLTIRHAVTGAAVKIQGLGSRQLAAAFDVSTPLRFAYMDGSDTGGYNIRFQTGGSGTATDVTTDASSTVSYWTPTWSPDGTWIMYAKISGTTGELWRVHPNGTGAEKLPITTTELPTYAIFDPTGTEVFVPGDFTSYKISDGTVGTYDAERDAAKMTEDLAAMGYEFVGSPLTGPTHTGDYTTPVRHSFPISAQYVGSRLFFDALVASASGDPPHEVLGIGIFSWVSSTSSLLKRHVSPMALSEARTEGYTISLVHPFIIP